MHNKVYAMHTGVLADAELFRALYDRMPAERQRKIDRYRFDKDKRLSLGAGLLLQKGLADCGLPTAAELVRGENEKPFLRDSEQFFFNLSHSGEIAVCAVSDRPVGVDVETRAHFEPSLVRRVFLPDEIAWIAAQAAPADELYTDLWTIKESLMKYLGTGLSLDPRKIRVDQREGITAAAEGYDCSALFFRPYSIPGYSLTVCAEYDAFPDQLEWVDPAARPARG